MPTKTLFIISLLSWLLLTMVRAFRVPSTPISAFELERRVKQHDKEAIALQERERHLPQVRALRFLLEAVLTVLFITLLVTAYGFWVGAFWSMVGLLLLPIFGRTHMVRGGAEEWYSKNEVKILELAAQLKGPLRFFQQDSELPPVTLHSKEELLFLTQQAKGVLSPNERDLLQHSLQFSELRVEDIMTPRSVVETVEANETVGALLLDRLHRTGHSRFPIIEGDIDHVVGMLYLHDVISLDKTVQLAREAMQSKVFYIRHDATLDHALHAFLRTHHHLFVVVNENRETVGIISLEDVIEALLGRKIDDEFDAFSDLRKVAARNPHKINLPPQRQDV